MHANIMNIKSNKETLGLYIFNDCETAVKALCTYRATYCKTARNKFYRNFQILRNCLGND